MFHLQAKKRELIQAGTFTLSGPRFLSLKKVQRSINDRIIQIESIRSISMDIYHMDRYTIGIWRSDYIYVDLIHK